MATWEITGGLRHILFQTRGEDIPRADHSQFHTENVFCICICLLYLYLSFVFVFFILFKTRIEDMPPGSQFQREISVFSLIFVFERGENSP